MGKKIELNVINIKEHKGNEFIYSFGSQLAVYVCSVCVQADTMRVHLLKSDVTESLYLTLYQNGVTIATSPMGKQLSFEDMGSTAWIERMSI